MRRAAVAVRVLGCLSLAEADVLHHSRRVETWVGLVGGAVVVLAAILRPLVVRRTRV